MNSSSDQDYGQFKTLFFRLTGINLSLYKEEQMKRRLTTFRVKKNMPDFNALMAEMKKSDKLLNEFLSRMTINVTEFYRNQSRWDILEEKIKKLAAQKKQITIWSAACSTGEEPYSLAMLLRKYFPEDRFMITASDIDREVLQKASEGRYLERAVSPLQPDMLKQYFEKDGMFYSVSTLLKKSIRFVQHDLLSDPAPGSFDLIVCRNVLIYFTDEGKDIIYSKLGGSLKDGGILFVGSTEQIFHPERYRLRSEETFFYKKTIFGESYQ
ncbi:protein-glutamate O-methyltransferase CheR [Sporolactobacillus shoreae]|uniref:protein-glutamate O-methyltransferase n=1 Tax=Sporolactobacillus shoreae TaxID=1465501 RepID=A0A4Z0GM65_9BACL|nr:protein-glutamate O-methyltransferase CheR [Sporolactobacillus shoreae]TGA98126.1 protein-glutamate O-methyltransferase CheR [Sporolactobacillus shoreae]